MNKLTTSLERLKQYEMTKLSEAKDVSPFQVLQKAKVPERKSRPKRIMMVVLSAVSAGFVMILFAFLCEAGERMNGEDRQRWGQILKLFGLRNEQ